ncbi:MAG TPA: 3-carboxy-cis,cis-muconate cycloisomerase [Casimicrobiaceae bacterium]|jgi:3-carboxy-cis,cis-muconate cycloisomerase
MPSTLIDSTIFGNLVGTEAMRAVFSDENRTQRYLDVEAALARVQARLGIIPAAAASEIVRNCRMDRIDMAKLRTQTERAGSPVVGVVQQLAALCAEPHGRYCHWGATTQDITDTATALQMRAALALIDADLAAIADALAGLALRYRDTPMAGRSHLQQAAPITFGYKVACLLSAVERHRTRLTEIRPRVLVGEFGGAVGTLASLGQVGLDTRHGLMRELELGEPDIAWHTQRDRIAEVGCFLGLITGTLSKLATDIMLMMQTEVGEVAEPFMPGRGASSTMPQKRNPVSSVYIHACAAVVRQHAALLLEAMAADHERATGPWHIEWIVLPEAFVLTAGALAHARTIVEGLQVDAGRMRTNLDLTRGLVVSEAVMMGLAPHLGRERAHDLVYELCGRAIERERPLLELLAETPEVTAHLDRQRLAELCDPANYLGLAGVMVDRVLAAREKH